MDDTPENEALVKELRKLGLAGKPHKGEEGDPLHVRMWVRQEYKCGYCGENLLTDCIRIFSAQLDHLLPRGKYPWLAEVEDNWVLACFPCNQLKRDFDPWKQYKGADVSPEPEDITICRDRLIEISRNHLDRLRYSWNSMRTSVLDITVRGYTFLGDSRKAKT